MIEPRLTGTFKMPNDLGAYLALSLPFIIGYFIASFTDSSEKITALAKQRAMNAISIFRSIRITLILGILLMVTGANLALTLTRAAWVSVTAAAACILFCLAVRKLFTTISWKRNLLAAAVISVLFCVLFLNTNTRQAILGTVPQHIKTRFQTIIAHPEGFMSERPQWWRTSIEFIRQYPLTGIGLGRFRYEYQRNGPAEQYETPYHAHNIYLHIAAEQGIPSLLLFLWMVAITCQRISGMREANGFWDRGTFIGASGFLISALIYGLADNILHQRTVLLFWFILGIIFYSQLAKDAKYENTSETR